MITNILYILENLLGSSKKASHEERLFYCPFCYHHKQKLSINIGTRFGFWKCWVCDTKGRKLTSLLYKINAPLEIIKTISEHYHNDDHVLSDNYSEDHQELISLPKEYVPLYMEQDKFFKFQHALAFLKKRKLTRDDILRYQIGYCKDGEYADRIIIPSYNKDMNLNYFISRSFYDNSVMKYKNPPISKNIIAFENLINWNLPVILVEGVFDAIALRRNAIPLFGKVLYSSIETALITNKPPKIYVMMDNDASIDASRIEQRLSSYGLDVLHVPVEEKDASDMGFEKAWKSINKSYKQTFEDIVSNRMKMYGI